MRKWLITGLIVVTLIGLGASVRWWFTPLMAFVGANTDVIQGLTDLLQLGLWAASLLVIVIRLWYPQPSDQSPSSSGPPTQTKLGNKQLRQVMARYGEYLLDRYRYLEFRGMGVSDKVPLHLSLVELYVPLKARIELPEGET